MNDKQPSTPGEDEKTNTTAGTHDEWDEALREGKDPDAAGKAAAKDDAPEPVYPTVEAFVTEFFAKIIRRRHMSGWVWCPQWWQHPEATARLDALWRAWEFLRLDGTTGMSVWWRDHCDPHLAFLTDGDRSPFGQCRNDKHEGEYDELTVLPAPPGWWDGDDDEKS